MTKIASINHDLVYNDHGPAIKVLMETECTKEIRILLKNGQIMKEHKAPFPIVIEIFKGTIDFGIPGERIILKEGDLITLSAHISHDLLAKEDSIVRLSLSKGDSVQRVKAV